MGSLTINTFLTLDGVMQSPGAPGEDPSGGFTLEMLDLSWDVCVRAGDLGRRLARRGQRTPTVNLMIAAAAASGGHDVWHVGDKHFAAIERAGGPRQRDLTKPLP